MNLMMLLVLTISASGDAVVCSIDSQQEDSGLEPLPAIRLATCPGCTPPRTQHVHTQRRNLNDSILPPACFWEVRVHKENI